MSLKIRTIYKYLNNKFIIEINHNNLFIIIKNNNFQIILWKTLNNNN